MPAYACADSRIQHCLNAFCFCVFESACADLSVRLLGPALLCVCACSDQRCFVRTCRCGRSFRSSMCRLMYACISAFARVHASAHVDLSSSQTKYDTTQWRATETYFQNKTRISCAFPAEFACQHESSKRRAFLARTGLESRSHGTNDWRTTPPVS